MPREKNPIQAISAIAAGVNCTVPQLSKAIDRLDSVSGYSLEHLARDLRTEPFRLIELLERYWFIRNSPE